MRVSGKAVFVDKYESQKTTRDYLTFVDADHGGQIKFTVNRGQFKFDLGEAVNVDVQCRAFSLQGGGLALIVEGGTITPVKPVAVK